MTGYVLMTPAQLEPGDLFKHTERGAMLQVIDIHDAGSGHVRVRVRPEPHLDEAYRTLPEEVELTLAANTPVYRRNRFAVWDR
jgi:hypothetical protein